MKKLNGFTLAEVLIVTVIIGIIAAISIPIISENIKNKDLESRFTKANSILKQTFAKAKAEE